MIEISNLQFSYPDQARCALKIDRLSVARGESVCIMGANGSGKSTLAKILARLLLPDSGEIRIDAQDSPIPVGILFQNPENQMVAVTVEKEIAFALENLGVPPLEIENTIEGVLSRFSISHLRMRLTSELSGGERQRVALASIMAFRPPILVLDEPDSFLDETGRASLRDELDLIRKQVPDLVEIRITQYPSVAKTYSRLIVFREGHIVADDLPAAVFANRQLCEKAHIVISSKGLNDNLVRPEFHNPSLESQTKEVQKIVACDLSYCWGTKEPVFHKLNLTLNRGEVLGLVGPSGSGKSSLGNLLCGILKAKMGSIKYLDATNSKIPLSGIRGRVAGIFQQPERQFFLDSCREEIEFGPKNLKRQLEPDETSWFFDLVGLSPSDFADRDPFRLSGGEKRRLAFATVLSLLPRIVVFDEPTCGLDLEGVGRFIRLGLMLKQANVGQVVISHDGDIIRTLADRILVLPGDGTHLEISTDDFFSKIETARLLSPVSLDPQLFQL